MEKIKKSRILFSALLLICAAFTSCSLFDKDDDDPVTPVLTPSAVTISEFEETAVAISGGEAPFQLSGGNALVAAVTVNDNSIDIKALKAGTSIVTVKGSDGGAAELVITVTKGPSTAPALTASTVEVRAGELTTVEVTNGILPFRLSGGDATIASVAINNGVITIKGLKIGTTAVTVTGRNGLSTTLTVQVIESLAAAEEDKYNEYVSPVLEDALVNGLGITINRGVNPPNVTGYYRAEQFCVKSTISGDSYLGKFAADYKLKFYDQKDIEISFEGFEVGRGANNFLAQHNGDGSFICGDGNKFSIFFNETTKFSSGPNSTMVTLFSGELVKDNQGKITGIKDFQEAILMRDNGGRTDLIANGKGRLFEDDFVEVITKEAFENLIRSSSVKSSSVNGDFRVMIGK